MYKKEAITRDLLLLNTLWLSCVVSLFLPSPLLLAIPGQLFWRGWFGKAGRSMLKVYRHAVARILVRLEAL